mmetsp:Transcript_8239/g.18419  ORF Transcript_8239/g.18419 Transcript_8239/m.18419 type:complete len:232 (+) Transcript_8239:1307-2002(+)
MTRLTIHASRQLITTSTAIRNIPVRKVARSEVERVDVVARAAKVLLVALRRAIAVPVAVEARVLVVVPLPLQRLLCNSHKAKAEKDPPQEGTRCQTHGCPQTWHRPKGCHHTSLRRSHSSWGKSVAPKGCGSQTLALQAAARATVAKATLARAADTRKVVAKAVPTVVALKRPCTGQVCIGTDSLHPWQDGPEHVSGGVTALSAFLPGGARHLTIFRWPGRPTEVWHANAR